MLLKAENQTQQALAQVNSSLKSIENGVNGVVATTAKLGASIFAVQQLGNAFASAAEGIKAIIKPASDTAESLNKAVVVFGAAGNSVLEFGKNSATGLGLSQQAAVEAAGTFGNLFVAMGFSGTKAAELSTSILKLGADLASFNNIPVDLALEKLRAGLVGEIEPLRTLGVNLTEATVQQRAVQLGLAAQGETLTAAGKALAAYNIIMEQTKTAQGDFANTSDGLANSTRIIQAQFQNLVAQLGQNFLPLFTDGAKIIKDFLSGFANSQDVVIFQQRIRDAVEGVRAFVGDLQTLLSTSSLSGLDAFLTVVSSRIRATFGDEAANAFESFTTNIGNTLSGLGTLVQTSVLPAINGVKDFATALFVTASAGKSFTQEMGAAFVPLDLMRGVLEKVNPLLKDHAEILVGVAIAIGGFAALNTVIPLVAGLSEAFTALFAAFAVGGPIAGLTALVTLLGGPVTLAIAAVVAALGLLAAAFIGNWGDIQTKVQVAARVITGALSGISVAQASLTADTSGLAGLGKAWETFSGAVKRAVDDTIQSIRALLQAAQQLPVIGGIIQADAAAIAASLSKIEEINNRLLAIGQQVRDENDAAASAKAAKDRADAADKSFSETTDRLLALSRASGEAARRQKEIQAAIDKARGTVGTPGGPATSIAAIPDKAKIEAEAKAAAKTAIEGFTAELQKHSAEFEKLFTPELAKLGDTLVEAIDTNTEQAGTALAQQVRAIKAIAKEAGVPDFEALGNELAGVFDLALQLRTEEAKGSAIQKIQEFGEALAAAGRLTQQSFANAFDLATLPDRIGSQGAAIMTALNAALEKGGAQNIATLAGAVAGMRRTFLEDKDLTPERAGELAASLMDAFTNAINDGSPEAIAAFQEFLGNLNFDTAVEKLGTAMADRINVQIQDAQEAIGKAQEAAKAQIANIKQGIIDSRTDRDAEAAFVAGQKVVSDALVASNNAQKDARRAQREEEALYRQEVSETAAVEKSYLEKRAELLKNAAAVDTSSFGGFRAAGAQAQSTTKVSDPRADVARRLKDLDEAHAKELAQLEETQAARRKERAERKTEQDADAAFFKTLDTNVATLNESQRTALQNWKDEYQDTILLGRQIKEVETSLQGDIDKINKSLDDFKTKEGQAFDTEFERLTKIRALADTVYDGQIADLERVIALGAQAAGQAVTANSTPTGTTTLPTQGISTGGPTTPLPQNAPPPPENPPPPPTELPASQTTAPQTTINVQVDLTNSTVTVPDLDTHIINTVNDGIRFSRVRV